MNRTDRGEQRNIYIRDPLIELRALRGSFAGDPEWKWTPAVNGAIARYLEIVRWHARAYVDFLGVDGFASLLSGADAGETDAESAALAELRDRMTAPTIEEARRVIRELRR